MKSTKRIGVMASAAGAAYFETASAWAAETAPGSNPYGLSALWAQGDVVAKGTLIILVVMSLGTWYIGVLKFLEQAKLLKQGQEAKAFSWQTASLAGGINELKQESAFRFIAQSAIDAASKHSAGQLQRVGAAKTAAGAGDDRHPVLEGNAHPLAPTKQRRGMARRGGAFNGKGQILRRSLVGGQFLRHSRTRTINGKR